MPAVLYPRQRNLLTFISQYIYQYGSAPTLKEMAAALGVGISTIFEHLNLLEEKGFLRKHRGVQRGLEVIDKKFVSISHPRAEEGVALPIMGFIAAGKPLEPYPNPDAYFSVAPSLLSSKKLHYILQVKGESLVDDGILDGDYVILEHRETAENGELVVALLKNGLATLKKIFYEKERVRLEPANHLFPPIYTSEVKIQGRVVGVIRKY